MAAEQRKLLEQLMVESQRLSLNDPKVCRPFCVDFCVHELFAGTKLVLGPCRRIHSERLRSEYSSMDKIPAFEREFYRQLDLVIEERREAIEAAAKKLELSDDDLAQIEDATRDLVEAETENELLVDEINELARCRDIGRAVTQIPALAAAQRNLTTKQQAVKTLFEGLGFSAHQKLQVCTVCGGLLSSVDTDRRLADHFTGKLHQGYAKVQAAIEKATAKS